MIRWASLRGGSVWHRVDVEGRLLCQPSRSRADVIASIMPADPSPSSRCQACERLQTKLERGGPGAASEPTQPGREEAEPMKKKRRPFEIVWDQTTGEMRGRELPLTKEEKLETFEKLRIQALTVDIARRRWETAKAEAKEAKEAWERECQRLYDVARHDPQGELFPVTDAEIHEANQRSLERSEPKKKADGLDQKSKSAGEKADPEDGENEAA